MVPVLLRIVRPVPDIEPPVQVSAPLTVTFAEPVRVPDAGRALRRRADTAFKAKYPTTSR